MRCMPQRPTDCSLRTATPSLPSRCDAIATRPCLLNTSPTQPAQAHAPGHAEPCRARPLRELRSCVRARSGRRRSACWCPLRAPRPRRTHPRTARRTLARPPRPPTSARLRTSLRRPTQTASRPHSCWMPAGRPAARPPPRTCWRRRSPRRRSRRGGPPWPCARPREAAPRRARRRMRGARSPRAAKLGCRVCWGVRGRQEAPASPAAFVQSA